MNDLLTGPIWPGPWTSMPGHSDARRNARLRSLVRHATAHCEYYRNLFDANGLTASDIRGADDLPRIPFLPRSQVRSDVDKLLVRGTDPSRCRVVSTNGTTGEPTRIISSLYEAWFQHALWVTGYMRCGVRPTHRQAKFMMGRNIPRTRHFFQSAGFFRREYMSVSESTAAKIEWLRTMRPDALFSWGSVLNEIALYLEQQGEALYIPRIISSSDAVLREKVATRLGGEVFDIYGATESGPIGWPCTDGEGFHIDPRWILVEILDDQGAPAQQGNIACTVLWRRTMPLIRYALGDLGAWELSPCHCGCRWPRIKSFLGRQADLLALPPGALMSTGFVVEMMHAAPGYLQYQLVQESPSENHLFIVPGPGYDRKCEASVRTRFLAKTGPGCRLHIKLVQSIYRPPNEKYRAICTVETLARMRSRGVDTEKIIRQ